MKEYRVGHGYDVHRLAQGRKLIMGGVEIPHETGLFGHSDADVLVHAVMDALLGAAALGDIGQHFPDSDPAYKGADSIGLLRKVGALLRSEGYSVVNIDATIIAEQPKMKPHIPAMRKNVAKALETDVSRVSVKATTEEGLGFTGERSGIAAHAVCMIEKNVSKKRRQGMTIISPSILSADFSKLGEEIRRTDKTSAEYIHVDVMDGSFVPNITIGPGVIASIRKYSKKIFDVHLMIDEPVRYVEDFAKAGADILTVHVEACADVAATLKKIRAAGMRAGLSIKPKTDPAAVLPYLPLCDMILVMTVEPGFGGQSFIPETVENVRAVKRFIASSGRSIPIEVDGGITVTTIRDAAKAGAEIFVAGSSVYRSRDIARAVDRLIASAERAQKLARGV